MFGWIGRLVRAVDATALFYLGGATCIVIGVWRASEPWGWVVLGLFGLITAQIVAHWPQQRR